MEPADTPMETDVGDSISTGLSQHTAVGPPNQGQYPYSQGPHSAAMLSNMSPPPTGEAAADGQDVEMSVDDDTSNQGASATRTDFTTGSSHVGTAESWAQNHSDARQRATNPENIPITQQPVKSSPPSYASHMEQHQPSRDTWQPGLTANAVQLPGGPYDGAKSPISQPDLSRHSPQDQDETGLYLSEDRITTDFSFGSLHRTLDTDGLSTKAPGLSATATEFPGKQYDGVGFQVSKPTLSRQSSQVQDEMPSGQMPDQQPHTHQDVAAALVQIECSVTEPTWDNKQKWKMTLHKAFQTFFNKYLPGTTEICDLEILDTPFSAKVTISPSSACDALLNRKSATLILKLKDMTEDATVHFKSKERVDKPSPVAAPHRTYPSSVSETHEIPMLSVVVNVQKFGRLADELCRKFATYKMGSDTLKAEGTFEEVERFYKEFSQVIGPATSSTSAMFDHSPPNQTGRGKEPMRVPLVQYQYFNHVHRKEMERIEEKHGVKIKADVCVSVEETHKANSESVAVASNEFADLFLKTTRGIESVPVPSRAEFVRDIQTLGEGKLMLSASAQNWSLLGPQNQVTVVQRLWTQANTADPRSERSVRDKPQNSTLHGGSRWDRPKGIMMDIKDPLLATGISVSHTHWELTKNAFKKQIKDIKNKFGVDFQERNIDGGLTVSAQSSGNPIAHLEVNALRALMSLYQKVVMTTMSCPLQNVSHTQTERVKMCLSDICKDNPSLAVRDRSESSGVWVMIGLPDHLRFAISEIEKKLGAHVFDEKHKDMIGCGNNDAYFLRPFADGAAWTAAEGFGAASRGAVNDNYGRETWKAEREPERRAGEYGAFGSSVDAVASTGLYREDQQKRGEAGRKEISEYGKHKDKKKGAGSTGRPHESYRALPGGADGGRTSEDDNCPICMDEFNNKEKLSCGHAFCKECLRQSVESLGASCPVCKEVFGRIEGDQPNGTMTHHIEKSSLPGFKGCGTIVIDYNIPNGIQSRKHPKPGKRFHGAQRRAYLPDNKEGREILALLKRAFNQRLIFTVGTSRTSGQDDCVTWNDIHHKTSIHGGAQSFGYPDEGYMKRVRDELKAKGIK